MFPLTHHRHVMLNDQVISIFLGKVDCIRNPPNSCNSNNQNVRELSCHSPPHHATKYFYQYQLFWTKVISKNVEFRMARKEWTKTGQVWSLFSTRLSNNSSQNMSLMFNPLDLYVSSASLPIWLSSLPTLELVMYKISFRIWLQTKKYWRDDSREKSTLFSWLFFTNKKNARHRGIKFQSCKWTPIWDSLMLVQTWCGLQAMKGPF